MKTERKGLTLVAGGAGFIGSHLCRTLLEAGEKVLCLDNLQTARKANLDQLQRFDGFRFVKADISRPLPIEVTREAGSIRRIYNLACAASPVLYQADPEHTMLTNVVGTDRLLQLAERSGARFLLTSTSEVYGDPDVHPQPETYRGNVSCTGPRACYDEGKRAAESLTFDFARAGRADIRVARIFNTYGPQMRTDDGRVISNFICQALAGEPLTIYGDGEQTRSFCYVEDTVDGLMRLMETKLPEVQPVNIGNQQEMSIAQLVEALGDIVGSELKVTRRPLPQDDPQRRRPDISRARQFLGWEPTTSLTEGLAKTFAWFGSEQATSSRSGITEKVNRKSVRMEVPAPRAAVEAAG